MIAGNHAPVYLAQQKGYWKTCGLDVSMAAGKGSSDTAQLVANGSQDFGLTDAVSVVAGRSKGLPIKSLGVLYQSNPSSLVSKKSAGITSLEDVRGKTFGAVPGPRRTCCSRPCSRRTASTPARRSACPRPVSLSSRPGRRLHHVLRQRGRQRRPRSAEGPQRRVLQGRRAGHLRADARVQRPIRLQAPEAGQVLPRRRDQAFPGGQDQPAGGARRPQEGRADDGEHPDVQKQLLDGAFEYAGDDLLAQNAPKWEATEKVLLDAEIAKKKVPATELFEASQ